MIAVEIRSAAEAAQPGRVLIPKCGEEIGAGVRAKTFSALEVTEAALERAHALDPQIKAFVTILDDMARQAAQACTGGLTSPKAYS